MKAFHVVCGLPRAGSTLICNILNQNPRFFASSTSPLCQIVNQIVAMFSASPEVKSELAADKDGSFARIRSSLRGLIEGWYSGSKADVVFDKGRGWGHSAAILTELFPDAKLLVCVRDLRAVFGSVEKHHRAFPLLDDSPDQIARTVYARADQMFSPQGMIGAPINGIEDLLRRKCKAAHVIQFEKLVDKPKSTFAEIYEHLKERPFQHDFEKIDKTATDLDALYLHKFPHEGSGAVSAPPDDEWERYVPRDIQNLIMGKFQQYNRAFGYSA